MAASGALPPQRDRQQRRAHQPPGDERRRALPRVLRDQPALNFRREPTQPLAIDLLTRQGSLISHATPTSTSAKRGVNPRKRKPSAGRLGNFPDSPDRSPCRGDPCPSCSCSDRRGPRRFALRWQISGLFQFLQLATKGRNALADGLPEGGLIEPEVGVDQHIPEPCHPRRQGISGCRCWMSVGMRLAASPRSSRLRRTASRRICSANRSSWLCPSM